MSMYSFIAKNSKVPLFVQLKMAIINDIKTGKYENMQKLPSRRVLAKELGLSTTTVNNAYQALVDEGYAITIDRSGFFVKSNIHIEEYDDIVWEKNKNCSYNFSYNNCETININTILLKSFERQLRNNKFSDLSCHGNKRGEMDFRIAIAKFLRNRRNINCQISDIFLGAGLQYLLTVIVMIFGRDKVYGFENPTDHKMYIWLKNLGVNIRLVDVSLTSPLTPEALDEHGIDVMFTMPENQLPTGRRMGKDERLRLARWCRSNKYIIEVATDGYLNYNAERYDTIFSASGGNNVIFIDSLDYTISSNTKAAFMVLPKGIIDAIISKLEYYSPLITVFEQSIYQDLLNSGQVDKLIKRNNKTMKEKRDFLMSCIEGSKIGDRITFLNYDSGMNMIGIFDSEVSGAELTNAAIQNEIKIFEMNKFLLQPNHIIERNAFVFGYAGLNIAEIENAVKLLEKSWCDFK